MNKRILITGGCGFLGSHVVEHILKNTDWEIVVLDRLDISGTLERIYDIEIFKENEHRFHFVYHDLKAPINDYIAKAMGHIDYVLHLAASTHVDRSIEDPVSFIQDNVVGTANLFDYFRKLDKDDNFTILNFSTDEVFGPCIGREGHKENEAFHPNNPYAASKVGQVAVGQAFYETYKLPVITTFTMNLFGERQYPEKLIPKTIRSVQNQEPMPIFAEMVDGKMKAVGSRFWIHARNVAAVILFLFNKGVVGEAYNIVGEKELTNLEIAELVASTVGKPLITNFVDVDKTRPGHDLRYALDGTKLKELGWEEPMSIEEGLKKTVEWTLKNPKWL